MRNSWILFIPICLLAGETIPNRYIVELTGDSVVQSIARTATAGQRRQALFGDAGRRYRAAVRSEQAAARNELARRGARVAGSVDTVANALFVRIPAARADVLVQVPGVKRVWPVRTFRLTLDHALPLHKIPQAWSLGGAYPQGEGVKIALIDTGIDITHPGFRDAGFTAPAGFPKVNAASDTKYTNQKVIAARSYSSLFVAPDPDPSARDHVGHGTATAMAAGGVENAAPLATITGAAPLAYLGSYKIFGSPGVNDDASEEAVIKAVDDAVADGMDVINLSIGITPAPRIADDLQVQALENAVAADVIVVVSAGNQGPDPNTIATPGTGPSEISVGASNNDRVFASGVTVGSQGPYMAFPGDGPSPARAVSGTVVDISASLDKTGLACGALPPRSLQGNIALVLRGTCYFETKLDNLQNAGAAGALVYEPESSPDPITMAVGAATLPALMVGHEDGIIIKKLAAKPVDGTLSFALTPFAADPNSIADFSGRGPDVDLGIKPDLLAVGENFYTAAEKTDPAGDVYNPAGYTITQGTSFSAPLVSGAAAVLKAARPGLTALQYRSLLINSAAPAFPAPGRSQHVQDAGAGLLDLSTAVQSTLAAYPASISFGLVSPGSKKPATLRLSNLGYGSENFLVSVLPAGGGDIPAPTSTSVQLDANTYFDLALNLVVSSSSPGSYEGFIVIQGTVSGIETRVPYWYGIPSPTPAHITVLYTPLSPPAADTGVSDAIQFRVTDRAGITVSGIQPAVTVSAGGGSVTRLRNEDSLYPGVWGVSVRLGPTAAASNVFRITAGDLTQDVTIISK